MDRNVCEWLAGHGRRYAAMTQAERDIWEQTGEGSHWAAAMSALWRPDGVERASDIYYRFAAPRPVCRKCGHDQSRTDARYCEKCGAKLRSKTEEGAEKAAEGRGRRTLLGWLRRML